MPSPKTHRQTRLHMGQACPPGRNDSSQLQLPAFQNAFDNFVESAPLLRPPRSECVATDQQQVSFASERLVRCDEDQTGVTGTTPGSQSDLVVVLHPTRSMTTDTRRPRTVAQTRSIFYNMRSNAKSDSRTPNKVIQCKEPTSSFPHVLRSKLAVAPEQLSRDPKPLALRMCSPMIDFPRLSP